MSTTTIRLSILEAALRLLTQADVIIDGIQIKAAKVIDGAQQRVRDGINTRIQRLIEAKRVQVKEVAESAHAQADELRNRLDQLRAEFYEIEQSLKDRINGLFTTSEIEKRQKKLRDIYNEINELKARIV